MPDAEVQILISAIDNMSATLKKIEATLGQTQASVEKQTEATTKTFDKQMGSLLVLGNAANTVDNIFTQYQNLQLRLENASERVANAQDRLTNAQRNLEKVTKKAGATTEEYADAQRQVEIASRSLQISQNNEARMNNMVIGTYISMSVQVVSLTASLGTMKLAVMGLAASVQGFMVAIGPVGWTLIGITAAIGGVTWAMQENTSGLRKWEDQWNTTGAEIENVINKINSAQEELSYVSEYSEKIGTEDKRINMLKLAQLSDEEEKRKIINQYLEETGQTTNFNLNSEIGRRNFLITQLNQEEAEREKLRLSDEIAKVTYHEAWLLKQKDMVEEVGAIEDIVTSVQNVKTNWDLALEAYARYYAATTGLTSKAGAVTGKKAETNYEQYYKKDFISRPGQPAVDFSPDDTIVGMKNFGKMGGMTINITGPIYGTNPKEIAKALSDELRKKVSI